MLRRSQRRVRPVRTRLDPIRTVKTRAQGSSSASPVDPLGSVPTPPHLAFALASGTSGPVLDPACGEGELLLAALRAGAASGVEELFGIEVDPARLQVARARLVRAAGPGCRETVERNLRLSDALDAETPWPAATTVLANPPWVSFSGPQRAAIGREAARRIDGAWPSLHGAFLVRIAEHVGKHGTRARVLLPSSVCEAERYGPVRAAVTRNTALHGAPIELGENGFPGVLEPAVWIELRPTASEESGSDAPWVERSREENELLERLREFPRLAPECFGDMGVHTGNCADELVERGVPPELANLREGRDLEAFRLGPAGARLETGLERTEGRRFRFASLERYRAVPVLVRQTANRPIAALHESPCYFRNTLLGCTPPEGLDPALAVAVLNGPVARVWHQLQHRDARQRAFPQVKVAHLRSIPFPTVERGSLQDRLAMLARAATPERRDEVDRATVAAYGDLGELMGRLGRLGR